MTSHVEGGRPGPARPPVLMPKAPRQGPFHAQTALWTPAGKAKPRLQTEMTLSTSVIPVPPEGLMIFFPFSAH